MRTSTKTVPWFIRRFIPKYEWRHIKVIAGMRALAALWFIVFGVILCVYGCWWGVLAFVAAGLAGGFAYQMPRWKLVLDAENGSSKPVTKRDKTA
jgi:hypothetical protein